MLIATVLTVPVPRSSTTSRKSTISRARQCTCTCRCRGPPWSITRGARKEGSSNPGRASECSEHCRSILQPRRSWSTRTCRTPCGSLPRRMEGVARIPAARWRGLQCCLAGHNREEALHGQDRRPQWPAQGGSHAHRKGVERGHSPSMHAPGHYVHVPVPSPPHIVPKYKVHVVTVMDYAARHAK